MVFRCWFPNYEQFHDTEAITSKQKNMKISNSPNRNSTDGKLRKQQIDWEIRNMKLPSSVHSNVALIVSSGVHLNLKWSPMARFPFRFPRLTTLKGLTMDSMCTSTLMTDLNSSSIGDPLQRLSNSEVHHTPRHNKPLLTPPSLRSFL